MPQIIAVYIAEYFAISVTTALIIVDAAIILGGMALSYEQQRSAAKKAKEAYNASQVDRMLNVVTTIGQRELVLGRVRKAGTVFGRASTGTNHEKFYMAIALAGHEIDAIETIYLNDVAVSLDSDGYVTTAPYTIARRTPNTLDFTGNTFTITGTYDAASVAVTRQDGSGVDNYGGVVVPITSVVGNVYTIGDSSGGTVTYQSTASDSKVRITKYLGAAGQAADPVLMAEFGAAWPSTSTVTGIAYLVVQCIYDETAFPSGLPSVSAIVRGAKVYDPRSSTTAWSENPALLMRHVLMHPQFGKRASMTAAEDARINAAANACDASATYHVGAGTVTRALFTAGTVLPYGNPAKSCLDDLAQAMGGMWAYAAGQFYCKAGVYTAPVLSLTDADLAVVKTDNSGQRTQQPISIGVHKARADKINVISPRIWDSAQDYKQVALSPLVASTLVTRDGAWLSQEVTMAAVTFNAQALHVAGISIRDARDPLQVTLPFKLKAYALELFDTITLTIPRYGWSAKEFIILGRQWTLDGLIQLTLKETAAAIFQMDASFSAQGYAVNTNLPAPWQINPPSNVVVTSGAANLELQADGTVITRVKVSWDVIQDSSILNDGAVEVEYRLAAESAWHTSLVSGNSTYVYLYGANAGDVGFVQVRTRNKVAVSDWSTLICHTVTGKTAGPGVVTGLSATGIEQGIRVAGTLPADVDLAYIEIWASSDNVLAHATRVALGLHATWDWIGLTAADGTKYIWVRAVNNSGNAGAYTGPVSATAGITATPGSMTGLAATSIPGGIRIAGTLPSDIDLAYVQIWWGTTNVLGSATLLDQGLANFYNKLGLVPSNGARFFWTRCFNTSGAAGAFVGPVSATAGAVDWQTGIAGTGKPVDFADVTTSILANSGTSIVMTSSTLFKTTSGVGGVFIGGGGITGKDTGGNTTFAIDGSTGAATFAGTISGGANINITGSARFEGALSATTAGSGGTVTAAVVANASVGSDYGGVFFAAPGKVAVYGQGNGTGSVGLYGYASSSIADGAEAVRGDGAGTGGYGVTGTAAGVNGVGVYAFNGTGVALKVGGKLAIAASQFGTGASTGTFVSTNKPGTNSSNTWLALQDDSGNLFEMPVWPR